MFFKVETTTAGEQDVVYLESASWSTAQDQFDHHMGEVPAHLLAWGEITRDEVPLTAEGDLDVLPAIPAARVRPRRHP